MICFLKNTLQRLREPIFICSKLCNVQHSCKQVFQSSEKQNWFKNQNIFHPLMSLPIKIYQTESETNPCKFTRWVFSWPLVLHSDACQYNKKIILTRGNVTLTSRIWHNCVHVVISNISWKFEEQIWKWPLYPTLSFCLWCTDLLHCMERTTQKGVHKTFSYQYMTFKLKYYTKDYWYNV